MSEDSEFFRRADDALKRVAHPGASPPLLRRRTFGAYVILDVLGEGGMGIVYLARHEPTHREVALKVIRPEFSNRPIARERFKRELETASRLTHPAICTVYDGGEVEGCLFIAMQRVEGKSLTAWIEGHHRQGSRGEKAPRGSTSAANREWIVEAVSLVERLARALHEAHEAGLLHRDIKPANIMVADSGQPVLLDFGLARPASGSELQLTLSGDIVGTPSYMAPEQIDPQGRELDRRADLYSLGATLYECLTGRRPFVASTREELFQSVLRGDLLSPRGFNKALSKDLEVALLTALDRSRERRYETALDFAEDLRRYRSSEPILARPASVRVRAHRWVQRNPIVATFVAALSIGMAVTLYLLTEIQAKASEIDVRNRALWQAKTHNQALGLVGAAEKELDSDPALALRLALRAKQVSDGALGSADFQAVSQLHRCVAHMVPAEVFGPYQSHLKALSVGPDGQRFLGYNFSAIRIWKLDGSSTPPMQVMKDESVVGIRGVRWSPKGDRIVASYVDGFVRQWDVAGEMIREFQACDAGPMGRVLPVHGARFSADGERIITAGGDGYLKFWSVEGECEQTLRPRHPAPIFMLSLSGDGKTLASGDRMGNVRISDAESGERLHTLFHERVRPLRGIAMLQFAPASCEQPLIVTAQRGFPARLWNYETGEQIAEMGQGYARAGAFCGDRIVVAFENRIVRVFDLAGRERAQVQGHDGLITDVESGGAGVFATAALDRTVRMWRIDGTQLGVLRGHRGGLDDCAFVKGTGLILTVAKDYTVRRWRYRDDDLPRVFHGHRRAVLGLQVDPSEAAGHRLASSSVDRTLRVWDPVGEQVLVVPNDAIFGAHAWLADGGLVTGDANGVVKVWSVTEGQVKRIYSVEFPNHIIQQVLTVPQRGEIYAVAVGARRPTGFVERLFKRGETWDHERFEIQTEVIANCWAVAKDGRSLAFGGNDRAVRIVGFDGRLKRHLVNLHRGGLRRVVFSPDGNRLLSSSDDGEILITDLTETEPAKLATLVGHESSPNGIDWSPDGALVATCSSDGTARLWRPDGTCIAVLEGHRGPVWTVRFSPDGRRLYSTGADRTIRSWCVNTQELVATGAKFAGEFSSAERDRFGALLAPPEDTFQPR